MSPSLSSTIPPCVGPSFGRPPGILHQFGTLSPVLGYGVGMAYLPADRTEPGTAFEIDVRGKTRSAEVRTKPLIPEER